MANMDSIALEPCPFCGEAADGCDDIRVERDGVIWCVISCAGCGAQIKETANLAEDGTDYVRAYMRDDVWGFSLADVQAAQRAAVAAWNRRAK